MKTDRSPGVGGRGGYASGTVTLAKNQTIYIYVGGQGATTENQQSGGAGGWNGGGNGGSSVSSQGNYVGAGGGGGASHVSLSNAQVIGTNVTTLSGTNYLIVAGGGGGAVTWTARAGAGGGTEGGAGATTGGTSLSPWYNSTLSTGRNGYNAVDYSSFSAEGTGGGGGGYLGGNAGTVTSGTDNQDCGGCGGSSNYNSTYVSNFTTTSGVREGAGKVTITFLSGKGTQASPYLIASTTDWNNLVSAVNGGETYSGTYFKMTANVGTVTTWMTGTFSGTFDGDGNTLTVGYSSSANGCAPFGNLRAATIKNLIVDGTISTSGERAGGIAWWVLEGNMTYITNCRVSATINSTFSGGASTGGIVGSVQDWGTDGKLTITGCAFTGSLLGSSTHTCGGFVGWNGGTLTIENSLFAPASVTMGTTYSATFTRGGTVTNSYYTQKFNEAQGMQARTIAKGDGVSTLSVTKGSGTTYNVAGITVYSNGVDYNSTFYGGSGQTVNLDLTRETPSGYQFKQYAASQGTLSDETTDTPTLTMPAANSTANDVVTISAEYDPLYNATFADGNDNTDWTIVPTSGVAGTTVTVRYEGENKVKSVTVAPKGALTGKFSVSSTSQVQFSKGNLQYVGTWQFAANQYDIFGASQTDNHRDLFGWGTKTNPNNTSTTNGDYSWAEWGENTITNGCTGWRTLTKDEWGYLFTDRANASTLRTFASINDVTGLIVMPDGWTASGVTLTITTANYTTNVLSTSQWATLEKQGCVFLPAAGGRAGTNVVNVGFIGDYWSSDASGETNAYDLNFSSNNYLLPQNTAGQRHYGWSVRLVRDVE